MKTPINQTNLSEREQEVLHLISEGLNTTEIASELFLSSNTIKTHRFNLLFKLQARNSAQLIRIAYENMLLSLPRMAV